MSEAYNPFEPPAASGDGHVPHAALRGGHSASLAARFGAAMIDVAVNVGLSWFVSKILGIPLYDPRFGELAERSVALFVNVALFTAINGYWLARYGQTIGKRMVGTRIVDAVSGKRASFSRIVFLRLLPVQITSAFPFGKYLFLLDSVTIFRKDRRCLHDLVAGTRVVKVE